MPEVFRIDREFKALIPPLQPDELAQLTDNLKAEGCRDALVVWRDKDGFVLLDGHNRYDICQKHKITFKTVEQKVGDRAGARIWIRLNQLGRRNLSEDMRAAIALKVYAEMAALSNKNRARQAANVRYGKTVAVGATGQKTITEVAKLAGVSSKTLRRLAEIGKFDPTLVDKIESGEMKIAEAREQIRKEEMTDRLESVDALKTKKLAGKYDVIVCNPPWPNTAELEVLAPASRRSPYQALTLDALDKLLRDAFVKHATDNCHIFLWANQKFLPVAFRLLEGYGIPYVCTFVWHRANSVILGTMLPQSNTEFAIYCRKGSPEFTTTKGLVTSFSAVAPAAGGVPEEFYDLLRTTTMGSRLDMFERRAVEGFAAWGRK